MCTDFKRTLKQRWQHLSNRWASDYVDLYQIALQSRLAHVPSELDDLMMRRNNAGLNHMMLAH